MHFLVQREVHALCPLIAVQTAGARTMEVAVESIENSQRCQARYPVENGSRALNRLSAGCDAGSCRSVRGITLQGNG